MLKINKFKKGVSPLIATVLLIAFSVALGAVVMNWGTMYVQDTSSRAGALSDSKVACSNEVSLSFMQFQGEKQICYHSNVSDTNSVFIYARLSNGPYPLEGIEVTGISSRAIANGTESRIIQRSSNFEIDVNVSITGADTLIDNNRIRRVELVPFIKYPNVEENVYCSDNPLVFEHVKPCLDIGITRP